MNKSELRVIIRDTMESHLKKLSRESTADNYDSMVEDFLNDIMGDMAEINYEYQSSKSLADFRGREIKKLHEEIKELNHLNTELNDTNAQLRDEMRRNARESKAVQQLQRKLVRKENDNKKLKRALKSIVESLVS